jgi:CRISPR-associated protein Csm3
MANKLIKKIEISGNILLKTGLHIGGTNSSMSIGGIDKGVIRNPLTNQPYIPGSSLKGKMRHLLQVSRGDIEPSEKPIGKNIYYGPTSNGLDAKLFGYAERDSQQPSRLIVRDANLINAELLMSKTEMPYTEGKTEVIIDRITSAASPRQIERVPAGAQFQLNMIINIWEQDNNENELLDTVLECLLLLKDDYLGGSGSRGYGQIAFENINIIEKSSDNYYQEKNAKEVDITAKYQIQINKLKS